MNIKSMNCFYLGSKQPIGLMWNYNTACKRSHSEQLEVPFEEQCPNVLVDGTQLKSADCSYEYEFKINMFLLSSHHSNYNYLPAAAVFNCIVYFVGCKAGDSPYLRIISCI